MTTNLTAGRTQVPEPRRQACAEALAAGLHLVVIDTETTGLRPTDRIIEVALVELPGGTIGNIWSSLVHPGEAPVRATKVHGITAAHLVGAPCFADIAPTITDALTCEPDQRTVLVGHRASFDAVRLAYEYRMAGLSCPPLLLLDTITLANATGVVSGTSKLDDLLDALGLANSAPHRAAGDALATAQAAARMLDTLARFGVESLTPLLSAPPKAHSQRDTAADDEMPPAHRAFHTIDLGAGKPERERALNGCLSFGCLQLPDRAEDTIAGPEAARAVFVWARDHLREDTDLNRLQAGILCEAIFRALRAPFRTDTVTGLHLSARPTLDEWGLCEPGADDVCDNCAEGKRTCRFVRVRHGFALSFLRAADGHIPNARADAFLPVPAPSSKRRKPTTRPEGWFAHLLAVGDTHTAAFGVVLAANSRRRVANGTWALAHTTLGWDAGLRTPSLAYLHSRLTEAVAGKKAAASLPDAFAICDEVVVLGETPDRTDWEHLLERHKLLHERLLAPPREKPAAPRNPRRPAANPFALDE